MSNFLGVETVWRYFLSTLKDYAIVLLDEDGHVAAWNEGAKTLKGYSETEILGQHFSQFYTAEAQSAGHPARELAHARATGRYEQEGWRVRKDNTHFWAHVVITAIYDERRKLRGYGKILRDETGRKQVLEKSATAMNLLEQTARTDYLTGLDNRRSFDMALSAAISRARRHATPLSLAMIDIDQFKPFNDEFGHLAGDDYLRRAAASWRQIIRPEDFIARYGGEEFVVVLPDTLQDGAAACLERLRAGTPAPLTCSVGIAVWDGAEAAQALIGRADHAAYQAKLAGRNRLVMARRPCPDALASL